MSEGLRLCQKYVDNSKVENNFKNYTFFKTLWVK